MLITSQEAIITARKDIDVYRDNFSKEAKQSNSEVSPILLTDPVTGSGELIQKVQEAAFFTRANNLIAEFQGEPTPIYANIQDSEPMGYLDDYGNLHYTKEYKESVKTGIQKMDIYKGYVIRYYSSDEIAQAKLRIDNRLALNLPITEYLTVEQQESLDRDNADGNELLVDDVELLKSDPNYIKPPLVPRNTYVIGADPIINAELAEKMKEEQNKYDDTMKKIDNLIEEDKRAYTTEEIKKLQAPLDYNKIKKDR